MQEGKIILFFSAPAYRVFCGIVKSKYLADQSRAYVGELFQCGGRQSDSGIFMPCGCRYAPYYRKQPRYSVLSLRGKGSMKAV